MMLIDHLSYDDEMLRDVYYERIKGKSEVTSETPSERHGQAERVNEQK